MTRSVVDRYLEEVHAIPKQPWWGWAHGFRFTPKKLPAGAQMLDAAPEVQVEHVAAMLERIVELSPAKLRLADPSEITAEFSRIHRRQSEAAEKTNKARLALDKIARQMMRRKLPWDHAHLHRILEAAARAFVEPFPFEATLDLAEAHQVDISELRPRLAAAVTSALQTEDYMPPSKKTRLLLQRIEQIGDETAVASVLLAGEAWSDAAMKFVDGLDAPSRDAWNELLQHAQRIASKPSKKWLRDAEVLVATIGVEAYVRALTSWAELLGAPRTAPLDGVSPWSTDDTARHLIADSNQITLKGLVAAASTTGRDDAYDAIIEVARHAYHKLAGLGPRAKALGSLCVSLLGSSGSPRAAQGLSQLKTRFKKPSLLKQIDKAINEAASASGLTPAMLEDTTVSSHGLIDGTKTITIGSVRAVVSTDGSSVDVAWFDGDKKRKTVPTAAKKTPELEMLRHETKMIRQTVQAVRRRLEDSYLGDRRWPFAFWREHVLDHPIVGRIARRLLWRIGDQVVLPTDDGLNDLGGDSHSFGDDAEVVLWHPIDNTVQAVLAWRERLDSFEIVQPFKQAHREIYVLTDAERTTGTYSNRMASHIVRQAEVRAMCEGRGWTPPVHGPFDGDMNATRSLPAFEMHAEFWTGPISEVQNPSGLFTYIGTDQVRFTGTRDGPPMTLESIPARLFSEVMRDVDLFVSVSSIGNDPTWADHGESGWGYDYWQGYAFAELEAQGEIRKSVLARIVPRLKIADRCTIEGRYLKVRGNWGTYRIHIGTANIMMANGQYLCIVAGRSGSKANEVRLPFEGDRMLAVVLSKAFMLAADDKITDAMILSQIKGQR